jgi:hypothetical protein
MLDILYSFFRLKNREQNDLLILCIWDYERILYTGKIKLVCFSIIISFYLGTNLLLISVREEMKGQNEEGKKVGEYTKEKICW